MALNVWGAYEEFYDATPACKTVSLRCSRLSNDLACIRKKLVEADYDIGCRSSEFEPFKSKYSVTEAVMRSVIYYQLHVVFDKTKDRWFPLRKEQYRLTPRKNVIVAIADVLCESGVKMNLGEAAYRIYDLGYILGTFGFFEKVYSAVRVVCNIGVEKSLKNVSLFVDFLNDRHWDERTQTLEQMGTEFKGLHKKRIAMTGKQHTISAYIMHLDKDILQELKKRRRAFPKIDGAFYLEEKKDARDCKKRFVEIVEETARKNGACDYTELQKHSLHKSVGWVQVFRGVLDVVFARGWSVDVDEDERVFYLSTEPRVQPRKYIPKEVVTALYFDGQCFSPRNMAFFAQRLYAAGYDLQSYADFEEMFFSVCLVREIMCSAHLGFTQLRQFFQYTKRVGFMGKTLESLAEQYRFEGGVVPDNGIDLVQRARGLEESRMFEWWGLEAPSGINQIMDWDDQKRKCTEFTLSVHAIYNDCCHFKLLAIYSDRSDVNSVLGHVMRCVYAKESLNVFYDDVQNTYTFLCTARETPVLPLCVFAERLVREGVASPDEMAYALHEAGYRLNNFQHAIDLQIVYTTLVGPCAEYYKNLLLGFMRSCVLNQQTTIDAYLFECDAHNLENRGVLFCFKNLVDAKVVTMDIFERIFAR